uniref:Uncharacterized protein n=1 Tax=Oryza brachyantha TaxID=4533 RepID=J3MCF8_ORYBR
MHVLGLGRYLFWGSRRSARSSVRTSGQREETRRSRQTARALGETRHRRRSAGSRRRSVREWSAGRSRRSGRNCGSMNWQGAEAARRRTAAVAEGRRARARRMRSAEKVAGVCENPRCAAAAL